jgi:DNA-binding response OmpR family regulator
MNDQRKRVLIVDNDEDILIALERLLETEGYDTVTAWSGQEANSLLQAMEFDLVLMDDTLADLSTEKLITVIQQKLPSASIIVLSSRGKETPQVISLLPRVRKWEHKEVSRAVAGHFAASA